MRWPRTAAGIAAALAASAARSHPLPPGTLDDSPVTWSFEPWVMACLAASAALYALGVARLWRRAGAGRGVRFAQAAAFAGGWLMLVAALVSPLDALGARLFSAHMLQHELLMVVAAPLLVLARPLSAWTWALPAAWRRRVGAATRHGAWRSTWSALTRPLSAWSLHAIALWGWHLPGAFDAALSNAGVHAVQHLSFLGTALLFWWTTLGAATRRDRGAAVASLFTTMIHTGALGALMSLSPLLWYWPYARTSATLGMDPLADQQLGGLIMWIPAGLAYLMAALWIASTWLRRGGSSTAEHRLLSNGVASPLDAP